MVVLQATVLKVRPGLEQAFETAFHQATPIIASIEGYIGHELHRCFEEKRQYLLLVTWESLEDHVIGFCSSSAYEEWRTLLDSFYDPLPIDRHYSLVR